MGWVTLSLRKQTLQAEINELNFQDIQLSRSIRAVHRHLAYETSIFESEKSAQLKDAKAEYNKAKAGRPKVSDTEAYEEWKVDYEEAKEKYLEDKELIEDYYDDIKTELEEEAKNKEDEYNDEKTEVETQRDAMNAELQAITDEIKSEIESSAIKF